MSEPAPAEPTPQPEPTEPPADVGLVLLPDPVEFGRVPVGLRVRFVVQVFNPRAEPIRLYGLQQTGSRDFSVESRTELPFTLRPREGLSLDVTFRPSDEVDRRSELHLRTSVEGQPAFELVGIGANYAGCPVAVGRGIAAGHEGAEGSNRFAAPVGVRVRLDATQSWDPDGEIASYRWSIFRRPEGSAASLEPEAWIAQPSIALDRPGVYRLDLHVVDDSGLMCEPAELWITAL